MMAAENLGFPSQEYITFFKIDNITFFTVFFHQINAALVSITDLTYECSLQQI